MYTTAWARRIEVRLVGKLHIGGRRNRARCRPQLLCTAKVFIRLYYKVHAAEHIYLS